MGQEGSNIIISINISFCFLAPPPKKKLFVCVAAGFTVPSLTIQTENICSMPLIVGGCFIYGVDGLALLLTRADGMSGRGRERKREREMGGGGKGKIRRAPEQGG